VKVTAVAEAVVQEVLVLLEQTVLAAMAETD
jgi:hypothetical protein